MTINLTYSIADQSFQRGKSIGIFNVSLNLLRHLSMRQEIGRVTVLGNSTLDLKGLPARVMIENHDEVLKAPLHRMAWDQFRIYSAAARTGNPWFLLAKGFASFMRRCPVKLAAVVYDTLHDYCEDHYPGSFPWHERLYFKRSLQATLRNASVIFTISDFTTSEVRRLATKYRIPCPPTYTMGIGFSDDDLLLSQLR